MEENAGLITTSNTEQHKEIDGLTEDGKIKLIVLCKKMEEIRAFLNCSINVHCMYRSQEYNKEVVKAIPNDVHAQFLACDFDCGTTHTIEEAHKLLEPVLEQYGVRMERNTPSWIIIESIPKKHNILDNVTFTTADSLHRHRH